jgi:nucleotide-binding universal stress UspA family protein
MHALTIVCPVDYSECSKRALRYAGALAEHFGAHLAVLHVVDRTLAASAAIQQLDLVGGDGQRELESFTAEHLPPALSRGDRLERVLIVGAASREILRFARSRAADLLVMGTHGVSGVRKLIFGSTLRTVLHSVRIPLLAVPMAGHGDAAIGSPLVAAGPVLAPVDFSVESKAAARAAAGLACALGVPLLLVHVIAPPSSADFDWRRNSSSSDRTRRSAGDLMRELEESLPRDVEVWTRIESGDPPEQIARLAREKHSPVVVLSLGSSLTPGRRPGSIAYRVLCLAAVPILALPETRAGKPYVSHLQRMARPARAFQ